MLDTGLLKWSRLEDYTAEVVTNYTNEFVESIVDLYSQYGSTNNQKSINYTPDRVRHCFHTRFEHGFYIVKFKGNIVVTFGVDDFQGWGVISRYLRHGDSSFFIPVGHGVGIPFAMQTLKGKIKGLCSTQNKDQKDMMGLIQRRYGNRITDNDLFGAAARLARKVRKLPHDVLYRNTVQEAYVYDSEIDPPFQAANTSFKRSAA